MARGGRIAASYLMAALSVVFVAPRPAASIGTRLGGRVAADLESSADEERLLNAVQDSLARKKSLDAKVSELDGRLRDSQTELKASQSRLTALVARQRTTEVKLDWVRSQMAANAQAIRDQAIAAYTGRSGANPLTDLLVHSDNPAAIANRQSYLRAVSATQADLLLSKEQLRDQTSDLLGELSGQKDKAQAERDAIASQTAKIQADRDAQAFTRNQVNVEVANYNDLLGQIIDRQDEFEGTARELQAQSDAVAEALGRRSSSSSSSSSSSTGNGRLGRPLSSITVASPYGWRIHPVYGDRRLHTGADLAATTGTPIRAAADGVVVSAGWLGGYGNATVIDHGGGLATLYGHQSALLVSAGQEVRRGQVIGRVGCTGTCTGPHLHFEVRVNGNPVDPMPYL